MENRHTFLAGKKISTGLLNYSKQFHWSLAVVVLANLTSGVSWDADCPGCEHDAECVCDENASAYDDGDDVDV